MTRTETWYVLYRKAVGDKEESKIRNYRTPAEAESDWKRYAEVGPYTMEDYEIRKEIEEL